MQKITIFCKASFTQGLGHLIRQVHIAKELRTHKADISFYIPKFPAAMEILKQNNFSYSTVEGFDTASLKGINAADVTILDIQDTTLPFIQKLKEQSPTIISFEDQGEGRNQVDLLIDCNLNSENAKNVSPEVKTFFGLPFSVLAPEFENHHSKKRDFPNQTQSLLITFGGTDPHNITLDLVKHIPNHFKTTIIVGPGFQNRDALQKLGNIRIMQNVQDMASMLAGYDVVFCSGGVTLHEAMCVGTPAIVISQVEHQEDKAKTAENSGAAINLGQANSWDANRLPEIFNLSSENLHTLSAAGKKCIDGKGLKRVVEAILTIC